MAIPLLYCHLRAIVRVVLFGLVAFRDAMLQYDKIHRVVHRRQPRIHSFFNTWTYVLYAAGFDTAAVPVTSRVREVRGRMNEYM